MPDDKVNINDQGYAYLPKKFRDSGFKGEISCIANHFTVLLVRPDADLEAVKHSLEVIMNDVEGRIAFDKRQKKQRVKEDREVDTELPKQ